MAGDDRGQAILWRSYTRPVAARTRRMMKRRISIICFLLCLSSLIYGQKYRMGQAPKPANPSEFPLQLHISASHIRRVCTGLDSPNSAGVFCTSDGLFVDAVMNGKKVELWGDSTIGKQKSSILVPGDYKAQLTNDGHNADRTAISQDYVVLLSDGTTWQGHLSGITE
jgi:hypothetical protein